MMIADHKCRCGLFCQLGKRKCPSCLDRQRVASKKRRDRLLSIGRCVCNNLLSNNASRCSICSKSLKEKKKALKHDRRERRLCTNCGESCESQVCRKCKEKRNSYRKKLRMEVLAAYGQSCACCGESISEFLTIDHINGGGNRHRKTLASESSGDFYSWLRREGFPDGFQTLCFNCNHAKHLCGICPHRHVKPSAVP